jgi:hypothetical protein
LHRLLVTDATLIPMFPRCRSLRIVDLSFCEAVTDRTLIELAEHCKTVERVITVRCLRVTGLGVNALLSRLPNLRDLNCGWCPLVDDEIVDNDDEVERSLALENVQLSWTKVTLAGVFTLLQQCRKLRVLGYCFGRSPLFDTLITSSSRRWTDPPVEEVFDSRGRRVEVDLPLFPGCLPCRSPFCENVESVPFEYGVCAGCKSAMYCSKACQGVAWHFGHGSICNVREVATELKYQPFLAEGIVKCSSLRVVDASGNRALADVLLGCLLVHQERYLRGARRRRQVRVAADEVAAASAVATTTTTAATAAAAAYTADLPTSPRATAAQSSLPSTSLSTSSTSSTSESQESAAHLLVEGEVNDDNSADEPRDVSEDRRSFSFHTQRAAGRWLATMPLVPDEPVALRCLCVSKCMMSDDRIRVLAPVLAGVTHMDLEKNCLTDKGVFALAQAGRSLRHLQVTGARLSLATASLLCNSASLRTSLRSLLIGGTGAMGPREARMVVRSCPNLRRLYVWSQMTDAEGQELQAWVDENNANGNGGGGQRDLLVLAKARLVDAEGVQ